MFGPSSFPSVPLPGVSVSDVTQAEALRTTFLRRKHGIRTLIFTPNTEMAYRAAADPAFAAVLKEADLSLPDGQGLVLSARFLGVPVPEKIPGIDFGEALLRIAAKRRLSVAFYGGKQGIAEEAAERMKIKYPGLTVCGTYDGYHPLPEDPHADLLFVCLGSPRQEYWAAEHAEELDCSVIACLGGALDVWSGKKSRAPLLMRRGGLEWLYRLIKEPSRFPRMLSIPKYLLLVAGEKAGNAFSQR